MIRFAILLAAVALLPSCKDAQKTGPSPEPVDSATTAETATTSNLASPTGAPKEAVAPPGSAAQVGGGVQPKGKLARDRKPPRGGKDDEPSAKAEDDSATRPTKGEVVTGAPFAVWLQAGGKYHAGKAAAVTAVLTAKAPYKCNEKYPYKFKLDAPAAGVTYARNVVRGMQVTPKRSSMSIPFTPTQAGAATIAGQLSFSVCTEAKCLIEKKKLSVTVHVD